MAVVGLALARRDLRRARPGPAPQAQAGSKS
jgi:hypothetical protein